MKYPDFAKCPVRSIYLARNLQKCGYSPEVLFGLYTPNKPRSTWDDRWKSSPTGIFVHCWVAVDGIYVDVSSRQFGELPVVFAKMDDLRYESLGIVDIATGLFMPRDDSIFVDWKSYHVKEDQPTVLVYMGDMQAAAI